MITISEFKTVSYPHSKEKLGKKYKGIFQLINDKDRSKLGEGRNYGLGFSFAKRKNNVLECAYAISPCRDYLNDEVYSEITGEPYGAYGLKSFKQNLFDDNNEAYLVMSVCKEGRSLTEYSNYKRDYKTLDENYKNLEKFVNWFESKLKLNKLSKIEKLEENYFVAICPLFWTQYTYLISLYSFLLRIGIFYVDGNPIKFIKTFDKDSSDKYLANSILPKLEEILGGKLPKQNVKNLSDVHNTGIVTYKW